MSTTAEAEREASEVLHSLLSVERIAQKPAADANANAAERLSPSLLSWPTPMAAISSHSDYVNVQDTSSSDTVDVEVTDSGDLSHAFAPSAKCPTPNPSRPRIRTPRKRPLKLVAMAPDSTDDAAAATASDTLANVRLRLEQGCECQGDCFGDQPAEHMHRHRSNVAALTREEHDMYLMGATMASLGNRKETGRHKERIRQRATYVYQGRRVCLDAFLYLENVTQYHLKRIRSHVMTNGVRPRVHGNHGKKPHNTLPVEADRRAEAFVNEMLARQSNDIGDTVIICHDSRANIYQQFKSQATTGSRSMGYSSFRNFLKRQFPHVRFVPKAADGQ